MPHDPACTWRVEVSNVLKHCITPLEVLFCRTPRASRRGSPAGTGGGHQNYKCVCVYMKHMPHKLVFYVSNSKTTSFDFNLVLPISLFHSFLEALPPLKNSQVFLPHTKVKCLLMQPIRSLPSYLIEIYQLAPRRFPVAFTDYIGYCYQHTNLHPTTVTDCKLDENPDLQSFTQLERQFNI